MSFYHKSYIELIQAVRSAGFHCVSVKTFLQNNTQQKCAILRHDVDRLAEKSLAFAQLEHSLGIGATYYFRCTSDGQFPETIIQDIRSLGHEIGYHYEDLSRAGGDVDKALASFNINLANLRCIAPCETVSMHGAPCSRHDNQSLQRHLHYQQLGLLGDAVADIQPFKPHYLTDTGGRWYADARTNFRDHLGQAFPKQTTPDKLDAFSEYITSLHLIYITTHPERWSVTSGDFLLSYCKDKLINIGKYGLAFARQFAKRR